MLARFLDNFRFRNSLDFSRRRRRKSLGSNRGRPLVTLGCSCFCRENAPYRRLYLGRSSDFRFSVHRHPNGRRSDLSHCRRGRSRFYNRSLDSYPCRGKRSDCCSSCCRSRNSYCREVNGRSSHNFRHSLLAASANDTATEPFFVNLLVSLSRRFKLLEIALFQDTLVALCVDSSLMQTLDHLFVFKSEFLGQFENFCLSHQYSPAIRW
jgi:hypothetical protein